MVTRPKRTALALVAPLVVVLILVVTIGQLDRAFLAKVRTLFDLQAIAGSRLGIWADSLRLIAGRPILGYGPDNVGLVFPRFQTGDHLRHRGWFDLLDAREVGQPHRPAEHENRQRRQPRRANAGALVLFPHSPQHVHGRRVQHVGDSGQSRDTCAWRHFRSINLVSLG